MRAQYLKSLAILSIMWAAPLAADGERVIEPDGNFLYYNGPSAIDLENYVLVAFLDGSGNIVVSAHPPPWRADALPSNPHREIVHSYIKEIDRNAGPSPSDHAAPAIFHDRESGIIWLATSYHGSDLYIYKSRLAGPGDYPGRFELYRHVEGKFTYPRFVTVRGKIELLLRETRLNHDGSFLGSLVSFDIRTMRQRILKQAERVEGGPETIYAGMPAVADELVFICYTKYFGNPEFVGLYLGFWDPQNETWRERQIGSSLPNRSVMPTGIWSNGKTVKIGVSVSEGHNYRNDEVVVLSVDLETGHETIVDYFPSLTGLYYHRQVAFAPDGNCIISGKKSLFPSFVLGDRSLRFVHSRTKRDFYSLRDFETEIVLGIHDGTQPKCMVLE